ncbi:hypothetical protein ACQP00_38990 [Dactylosporangium sp. CS-047395]|uniref:hypothetical protein n=1 Tax=Dactylosporangium sp. CS-047395 TaxID=3239936 RepID=UPI003D8A7553
MPDDVRPISPKGTGSLRSVNGIGFGLKGFTRTDADGYCFATRWFMLCNLPVIPLGRYYVREGATTNVPGRASTQYSVAGRGRLRLSEVGRTLAFSWLTTIAVVAPVIAVLWRADDVGLGWSLAMLVLWPAATCSAAYFGLAYYRKHLAPLREVHWVAAG